MSVHAAYLTYISLPSLCIAQSEWSHARGRLPMGWSGRGGQCYGAYYPNVRRKQIDYCSLLNLPLAITVRVELGLRGCYIYRTGRCVSGYVVNTLSLQAFSS